MADYHGYFQKGNQQWKKAKNSGFQKGNQLWLKRKQPHCTPPNKRSAILDKQISDDQMQFFVGSVLGDGWLARLKSHWNAYFGTAGINRDYVYWKHSLIANLCSPSYPRTVYREPPRQTIYTVLTGNHPTLTALHQLMYSPHKWPNPEIFKWVTPLAIAVWYMDDGHLHRDRHTKHVWASIATCSFTVRQVQSLCDLFMDRYGIPATIAMKHSSHDKAITYPVLTLNGESTKKFCALIESYVVPSMRYKLGC